MNAHIESIVSQLGIPQEDIHVYVFADERAQGWGSAFIRKAGVPGSEEQRILLESAVTGGWQLLEAGRLTLVTPLEWLPVFHRVNDDPKTLRPSLNWMAEEYLLYKGIIAQRLPKEKWQTSWGLNHADNYMHVEYYVDTGGRRIIPNCDVR